MQFKSFIGFKILWHMSHYTMLYKYGKRFQSIVFSYFVGILITQ